MVQNMRAYFILYVITIKCINLCKRRLNFLVSYKTKADLNQNFRKSLLGYRDIATKNNIKKLPENFQGWQKDGILLLRGGIWHPIATGLSELNLYNKKFSLL